MRSAAADTDHDAWNAALPGRGAHAGPPALPEQRAAERPPAAAARWQFPAQPVHARMARIWLEAWIADRGLSEEARYRAAVAFSELVTNAVLHTAGPVTVAVAVQPGRIECEVSDGSRGLPVICRAGDDDEHHRGLSLVEALTTRWRIEPTPEGGKAVAFVIEV